MTTELLTSYIDSSSLEECLDLYFQGTFDDVDQYLPRLYRDSSELKPGNSLFGQLDSADLELALWGLGALHRAAIEFHFIGSEASWLLLRHYHYQDDQQTCIETWMGEIYLDALQLLSNEVLGLL
ncbi:hypothetical protein [Nostoc sp. UIC 10630]|uniref:hypothetical protein n=1 Tax=Nostoc sp. UIC 10630 TaxID=2100146 RepID=UPI0013D3F1A5|nr:hypothetical protein [Nostoc sp. UIC 10630]NEU81485.1 hypothetical protein [Nostoc sp. UIC 10630]